MKITYNGEYPSLCSGELVVTMEDGKVFEFCSFALGTGGAVWFDEDWVEHVEVGDWKICIWPDGFPEDRKAELVELVNKQIPKGCCGGCV